MQNSPGGQGPEETRNLILFAVLAMAVFLVFNQFFFAPQERARQQTAERAQAAQQAQAEAPEAQARPETREDALARSAAARVQIHTDALDGSIALQGGRIDDLSLRRFRQTVDPESPEVTLLAPNGTPNSQDAFFGWEARDGASMADSDSLWTLTSNGALTPQTPITMTLQTENGLTITRTIALDDQYMFTITDRVVNSGARAQDVRPFGAVRRLDLPADYKVSPIVQQGMTGVFGPDPRLHETRFENAKKFADEKANGRRGEDARILELSGRGGWLGLSDHYWLTALVPDQRETISGYYDARAEGQHVGYRAAYRGAWRQIAPGAEITYSQRLFAGAKLVDVLRAYQHDTRPNQAIPDFDKAVDWGNFFILTRPYFDWLLHPLGKLVGSFGIGILLTTIVVKALLFPVVFQSNVAMTKLRKIQPKMKEIQDRFAADKQRQQQEMIRLYQTEKINPIAGCVPILLQIPVFYALYKTLTVTIEMRHAPFIGWIRDLSAPDPLNLFNLFGLLPYDPTTVPLIGHFLHLGPLAIGYGLTMWALQALNPPPTDPTQAVVFRFMPILFTFLFAAFPAGLVIYWTWSNLLSILQQYVIMRSQGVDTELDRFIAKRLGRGTASAAE